jgi:hypothetical protein
MQYQLETFKQHTVHLKVRTKFDKRKNYRGYVLSVLSWVMLTF